MKEQCEVHSHNWKDFREDNAGLSQVLVENALVKIVGAVLHLCGLENRAKLNTYKRVLSFECTEI